MRIGILAIQGSFSLHKSILSRLGAVPVEVRSTAQLQGLDGIILPGGESTTFQIILAADDLGRSLVDSLRNGLPVWGTCAGAILLGRGTSRPQPRMELIDIEVTRNAYGRQVDSFVAPLDIIGMQTPFPGVFIRAPRFSGASVNVSVLASLNGDPVAARQGNVLITSFHPELTSDDRIHRYFIERVCGSVHE